MQKLISTRIPVVILCALAQTACITLPAADNAVQTTQGQARGVATNGTVSFLGIEYARAQRWALPEDGPSWVGQKTFDTFGPACPQDGQETMVEDCLFLNVFAAEGADRGDDLPVLVWIHGGGLRAGQGGEGPKTFTRDGVIVVTFNYRLGLLGFRDWQGWGEQEPRNFGQADMVKALRWVKSNIRDFGGDPGNITLAGHSAGGMGVQLMMIDPRARGLFQRALSDAGYGTWPFPRAANPSPEMRARIRYAGLGFELAPAELVARTPYYHLPYVGGSDLPRQPIEVFEAGDQAPVPYMSGGTSFDGHKTLNGAGYSTETLLADYRDNAGVSAAYAADFAVSDDQAAARLFGDMRYVFAAWATTRAMQSVGQPGYLFYYDQPMSELPGTPHGGHYGQLFAEGSVPLKSYLLSFIKTGVPEPRGLPKWEAYREDSQIWMVFDPDARPTAGALTPRMQVLKLLSFPPPHRLP